MLKKNNLVATAIKETFDKTNYNYLLGDWCRKLLMSPMRNTQLNQSTNIIGLISLKWIKIWITWRLS